MSVITPFVGEVGSAVGSAVGSGTVKATAAAGSALSKLNPLAPLTSAAQFFTDPHNWQRLIKIAVGSALIVVGTAVLVRGPATKVAVPVVKATAKL